MNTSLLAFNETSHCITADQFCLHSFDDEVHVELPPINATEFAPHNGSTQPEVGTNGGRLGGGVCVPFDLKNRRGG